MATNGSAPRKKRSRGAGSSPATFAALDLGTNNCRLLIAERDGDGFRVVDSFSRIVRLGEGLAATGNLSDAAMDRAIEALKVCQTKIRKNRVRKVRCITTQACRAAGNGSEFLLRIKNESGLDVEAISPKEEAKLALLGSLDLIEGDKDFVLVVDIGGGSTELCWVDAQAAQKRGIEGCAGRPPILGWASFPVGVVTLSEASPEDGPDWYAGLVEDVRRQMSANDAAERFGPLFQAGRGYLIGTSGTVTSLAAMHLALPRYNRSEVDGSWMSRSDMVSAREKLRTASPQERAAEPCIGPDRSDLVLAGCAILDAIWELWPGESLRAADRGLREGVLLSLIHGKGGRSRRRRSGKRTNRKSSAKQTDAQV